MPWEINPEDLKKYPHFDKHIDIKNIYKLVTDPERVPKNSFYPFIMYEKRHQPFRSHDEGKPGKKIREIRYSSRRDAYIFSYYRYRLNQAYEPELLRLGLSDCVIAYRRIPVHPGLKRCKCNIDFAKEAFEFISDVGECTVVVMDISRYFESIDHSKLYAVWCRILGVSHLSSDYEAIYRNITSYSLVKKDELYERLGYTKVVLRNGKQKTEYVVPFKDMPTQLCSNVEFREKIAGNGNRFDSLIKKNREAYGIPQGASISDLLANMYLIDFDIAVNNYATSLNGIYRRYSDDILLVIPGGRELAITTKEFVKGEIEKHGDEVKIHDRKCSVSHFEPEQGKFLTFSHLHGKRHNSGLEYLGFRFDGRRVFLRDATVSSLFRKMSAALSREAHSLRA